MISTYSNKFKMLKLISAEWISMVVKHFFVPFLDGFTSQHVTTRLLAFPTVAWYWEAYLVSLKVSRPNEICFSYFTDLICPRIGHINIGGS